MDIDGCCGVVCKEGGYPEFFALSYHDFRVYTRKIAAGEVTIAEELDDFMGLDKCNLIETTSSEFAYAVIKALKKFQSK